MKARFGPGRHRLLLPLLVCALLLGFAGESSHPAVHAGTDLPIPLTGDGDRVVASGDLILQPGEVIAHNAGAALGNIEVPAGAEVQHDVIATNGAITIGGKVGHDVIALNGNVTLLASARIGHDVHVTNGKIQRDAAAQVAGKLYDDGAPGPADDSDGGLLGGVLRLLGNLALGVVFVGLGTLLILAAPKQIGRVVTTLEIAPWPTVAVGVVTGVFLLPVVGLASLILTITVIGILVLPFLWLAAGLAWAYGLVVAGLWAGRRLAESGHLPAAQGSLLVTAVVGMSMVAGLLAILNAVLPWLGGPLAYFLGFIGVGAAVLSRLGSHSPRATRPLEPPERKAS
ncbi:MAG: hypothetical protein M3Z04_23750 [Chloroflexota bacterium]|nr:hypothetical protein [Chloroflexota bacterium]